MKYRSRKDGRLTPSPEPGRGTMSEGQFDWAVSSQTITEEFEGTLGAVGNRATERKGISVLNCEADRPSRCESRT